MRRGNITSGSASTRARDRLRTVASGCCSGIARTNGSRATRRCSRPAGAKPGECSRKPASRSPRSSAGSWTSLVASSRSSCTRGCAARNARTQVGSSVKPTVEMKPRRSRPASPSAAARACAGSDWARASNSRACGSSASPTSVSWTLRLVRSNSRTPSRRSSCAMACVNGGCVMCRRIAARPKCSVSARVTNWRHRRNSIQGWLIRRAYYCMAENGLEGITAPAHNAPSRERPRKERPMAEQKIQLHLRSDNITQGKARAPNRSMYYAMGYKESDFGKPMVGVANGHSTITPCNSGLQKLADAAVAGIAEAGGNPQIFGTPTISDGMAMGTEGMKYSLVSREVIADCIETCVQGQWMDGVLVVGGCDKNMPGGMMGMLRANVPAIYVYGGTILPGKWKGEDLNIVSVFEAVGQDGPRKAYGVRP